MQLCSYACVYLHIHVHVPIPVHIHIHAYLPAIRYDECNKANYEGGVRYTKNVVKQIVKVNYQGWVSNEGII